MLSNKFLGAIAALAFTVTAANAQVVVSSKIDTEGGLLGNVISQVLQANGIAVTEKIQLGGTPVQLYDQARDGVVDVVWTLPGTQGDAGCGGTSACSTSHSGVRFSGSMSR